MTRHHRPTVRLSSDEKPGMQALGRTAPDRPPQPGVLGAQTWQRDDEICPPWDAEPAGGPGSRHRRDAGAGPRAPSERGIHRGLAPAGCARRAGCEDPDDPRQPLRPHGAGDASLPRDAAEALGVRVYPDTRGVAELGGDVLREADLPISPASAGRLPRGVGYPPPPVSGPAGPGSGTVPLAGDPGRLRASRTPRHLGITLLGPILSVQDLNLGPVARRWPLMRHLVRAVGFSTPPVSRWRLKSVRAVGRWTTARALAAHGAVGGWWMAGSRSAE